MKHLPTLFLLTLIIYGCNNSEQTTDAIENNQTANVAENQTAIKEENPQFRLEDYANKWIVIAGNFKTKKEASAAIKKQQLKGQVLSSNNFSELKADWMIVVLNSFTDKADADKFIKNQKEAGINCYARYTGALKKISDVNYMVSKISNDSKPEAYLHTGLTSPDGKIIVHFEELDPTADEMFIEKNGVKEKFGEEFWIQTEEIFWASDSRHFAFVNTDSYAGSGDFEVYVVNVETMTFISFSLSDFSEGIDIGNRESYWASNLSWSKDTVVLFDVSVNFRGSSGHPGIDSNLEQELGDDFEKIDPMNLGSYRISIK